MSRKTYLIQLPGLTFLGVGYEAIPARGTSTANSEAHAVSQYVHRHNSQYGPLIVSRLKEVGGSRGLGAWASEIPSVGAEPARLPTQQKTLFSPRSLACFLR